MKISLNWIKQFTDIDVSTEELVKLATERLGGVESVTDLSKHYEGIVVAKVVSCIKHPNADKLSLCKVDDGSSVKDVARDRDGYIQVVCGAPNVCDGLLVAWIPPGSIVPSTYGEKELLVLDARELRGEISNGMLASPAELGINDDHSGILEIQEDVKPGTPFKNLYDLDDTILEIENKMFTHRPDGFGHLGVAREIAGIQHKAFKSPEWYLNPQLPSEGDSNVSVAIEDPELCPRYMAVEFQDVKVRPSPLWLQSYLKRVGIRPINNIVDSTNYIALLTAQPVHAFDFDKIAVDKKVDITVRKPLKGEKMVLLDGKEVTPHADATLICNPNGPIALGGVMGGGNSEIDQNTTHVVLECATFNMYNVRKTSMIHGLFTEAATRLTKGQPAAQLPSVLVHAIDMFKQLAGAKVVGSPVDTYSSNKKDVEYIEIEAKFINNRLGSKLSTQEIVDLLTNVEFEAHEASGPISVTPPFWRTDIEIPEDIVEEVGRLYGFNQLPVTLPTRTIAPVQPEPKRALKTKIRQILASAGANEVLTYSFVHGDLLKKAGQKPENSYTIRNALSPDLQYYRQSLTPSLLDLVHSNIKAGYDEFALFEINKAHNKIHGLNEDGLPGEIHMIALTLASKHLKSAPYYNARRILDYVASSLNLELTYQPITDAIGFPVTAPFELSRSALVTEKETGVFLGIVGEYTVQVQSNLKLPSTAGFEISLDGLIEALSKHMTLPYQPLSKYPATHQDVTFKVSTTLPYVELEDLIHEVLNATELTCVMTPVSIYQPEVSSEFKNITFRITLSSLDRTLKTEEVNKLMDEVVEVAGKQLGTERV